MDSTTTQNNIQDNENRITRKAKRKGSQRKHIVQIVLLLVLSVLILEGINTALYVADGSCHKMVQRYRSAGSIDTIFVGSSYCNADVNAEIFDKYTGRHSVNAGSGSQPMSVSYGMIREAIEEHQITTAVLITGYEFFRKDETTVPAEVVFCHEISEGKGSLEKTKTAFRYVTAPENFGKVQSVNYFFPWVYNKVEADPKIISENIYKKLHQNSEEQESWISGEETRIADFNDYGVIRLTIDLYNQDRQLGEWGFDQLDQIVELCRDNDCQLIVINTPYPAFNVLSYGLDAYWSNYKKIKTFLNERNVPYFDYNFAKPELYENRDVYYCDSEHLNIDGAAAFSISLAKLFNALNAGTSQKDLDTLFYSKEEYEQSIDKISAVTFDYSIHNDQVQIHAAAYAGSTITPEYKYMYQEADGAWKTIQDYSENSSITIRLSEVNGKKLRVCARKKGSTSEYDRYCDRIISY